MCFYIPSDSVPHWWQSKSSIIAISQLSLRSSSLDLAQTAMISSHTNGLQWDTEWGCTYMCASCDEQWVPNGEDTMSRVRPHPLNGPGSLHWLLTAAQGHQGARRGFSFHGGQDHSCFGWFSFLLPRFLSPLFVSFGGCRRSLIMGFTHWRSFVFFTFLRVFCIGTSAWFRLGGCGISHTLLCKLYIRTYIWVYARLFPGHVFRVVLHHLTFLISTYCIQSLKTYDYSYMYIHFWWEMHSEVDRGLLIYICLQAYVWLLIYLSPTTTA